MDRIEQHLDEVYKRIDDKKASLESMAGRYRQLMNYTDTELKILNSNDRLLQNSVAYNSLDPEKKIKDCIRERVLNGYSPDELENEYKQALYGIGEENSMALEMRENLDVVPKYLDARICLMVGHKPKYLLEKCRTHKITKRELLDIVQMMSDYQTNFPTIMRYVEESYSVKDVSELLRTRDLLKNNTEKKEDLPTLKHISGFYEKFGESPVNADELFEKILEVHDTIQLPFASWSIERAIETAEQIGATHFDTVMDFFNGDHEFSKEIFLEEEEFE
jgi:hypothetical protein